MSKHGKQQHDEQRPDLTNAPTRGGMPGDGKGRTDEVSTKGGVYPVSGPPPDDPNARTQGMASFGQGDRGAAGFQDHGQSEIFTVPPEGEDEAAGEEGH
jgi:hypothetical protein